MGIFKVGIFLSTHAGINFHHLIFIWRLDFLSSFLDFFFLKLCTGSWPPASTFPVLGWQVWTNILIIGSSLTVKYLIHWKIPSQFSKGVNFLWQRKNWSRIWNYSELTVLYRIHCVLYGGWGKKERGRKGEKKRKRKSWGIRILTIQNHQIYNLCFSTYFPPLSPVYQFLASL